jgi:capsid protein
VPYFVLTGDYSQVNFSSGRMGWLEFQRCIEQWRWNMVIPRFLDPTFRWFEQIAALVGVPDEGYTHGWTAPRREMIDPLKEIEAILLAVKGGLQSLPEAIREIGYDPDEVIAQIEEHNSKLDAKKIVIDSDPRQDPKRLAAKKLVAPKESS